MTKVHIITQGCSANVADSEIMAGQLQEKYELVDSADEADVVVFNTCTVKGPTESSFKKKLNEFRDKDKKIILAGCIPQSQTARSEYADLSMVGTTQVDQVGQAVETTLHGGQALLLERKKESRLNLPKVRRNSLIEIVPISQGCLSACTYCKTKHARGALYSTPINDIVRHVSKAVEEGAKEIWVTSQDCSAYGLDIGTNIAELLRALVTIPRHFMIRLGMANPLFITDFLDEFIDVMKHPKIFKFLHLPLQAGNNKVLEDMKRGYTVEEFIHIASRFKEQIPELTLATDIICGYPTENAEAFEDTLRIVEQVRPDVVNISRFWPREGTPASRLKQIDGAEVKRRSKQMTELHHKIAEEEKKQWLGWKGRVLISEKGRDNQYLGRHPNYKQIIIESEDNLVGKTVHCEVKDTGIFDLKAEVIL